MKRTVKVLLAVAITLLILVGSIAVGSVNLTPGQVAEILMAKLSGKAGTIDPNLSAIVWGMRVPRAVLPFLTGAALSFPFLPFCLLCKEENFFLDNPGPFFRLRRS